MKINEWLVNKTRVFLLVVSLSFIALGITILASGLVDNLLLSAISLYKGKPPTPYWLAKLHELHMLGVVVLLSGVVAAGIGWLGLPRWYLVVSLAKKDLVLLASCTITLIVLWLPVVLIGHSETIAGERYWWLCDDAMISMRYARNLANGFGLVWNQGERIEGYTNFLWTTYMALVHLLDIPASKTSLVVLLTNIGLSIASIPIIIRFIRFLGGGTLATVSTLVGYVLNKSAMTWTTEGLETMLLTFVFLLSTYRVIKESQLNQPRLLTYILIATMSLVRADAVILSVLLYGVCILLNRNKRLVVIYSAISITLPVAHEIFRIFYYGDLLPNTAYLKALNWNGRYTAGLAYILDFAKHYAIMIAFAVIGSVLSRRKLTHYLLAVFLLYMAYVAYAGGDAFSEFRFFVPVIPLLMILCFLGVQRLSMELPRVGEHFVSLLKGRFTSKVTISLIMIFGVAIALLSLSADFIGIGNVGFSEKQLFGIALGLSLSLGSLAVPALLRNIQVIRQEVFHRALKQIIVPFKLFVNIICLVTIPLIILGYSDFLVPYKSEVGNIRIGLLLKQNTPPNSKVADFYAGSVFYFSERYAIDLLGKSDRYIARLNTVSNGTIPGHNKFDFDYSLGELKPDYVVANFDLPIKEERMKQESIGDYAYAGQLYFNVVFRDHCLPNPIEADTWRTIFVCDWSPQIKNKNDWMRLPFE